MGQSFRNGDLGRTVIVPDVRSVTMTGHFFFPVAPSGDWQTFMIDNGTNGAVFMGITNSLGTTFSIDSNLAGAVDLVVASSGIWYSLALVGNGTNMFGFVRNETTGAVVGDSTGNSGLAANTGKVWIGNFTTGAVEFPGYVENCKIFNVPMTLAQIKEEWAHRKPVLETACVGHFPMDNTDFVRFDYSRAKADMTIAGTFRPSRSWAIDEGVSPIVF